MRNKVLLLITVLEVMFLSASLSDSDEGKDTLLEKLDILVRVQKLLQTGKVWLSISLYYIKGRLK